MDARVGGGAWPDLSDLFTRGPLSISSLELNCADTIGAEEG